MKIVKHLFIFFLASISLLSCQIGAPDHSGIWQDQEGRQYLVIEKKGSV